jgi:hypothetical protein
LQADFFEYFHNIRAVEVEPRFDRRLEARERVNYRKHPQLAAGGKLIMNKVHRPGLVGRVANCCLDPALRPLAPQLQAHLAVQPVDPLRIHPPLSLPKIRSVWDFIF